MSVTHLRQSISRPLAAATLVLYLLALSFTALASSGLPGDRTAQQGSEPAVEGSSQPFDLVCTALHGVQSVQGDDGGAGGIPSHGTHCAWCVLASAPPPAADLQARFGRQPVAGPLHGINMPPTGRSTGPALPARGPPIDV